MSNTKFIYLKKVFTGMAVPYNASYVYLNK